MQKQKSRQHKRRRKQSKRKKAGTGKKNGQRKIGEYEERQGEGETEGDIERGERRET